MAPVSKDGEPNVAPMGAVFARDAETSGIGNHFMRATIQNVLENPRACPLRVGSGDHLMLQDQKRYSC
ncbi:MAG: pyridoxamine 5'-phosphate oxidase family protein [Methanomicrobiales archaeon]|nr:pyridoxamine 5'-phosphate oxidase family protein [Methanomicrobiales archaeon]